MSVSSYIDEFGLLLPPREIEENSRGNSIVYHVARSVYAA